MSLRRRRHWYVSSLVIPFSSVPLLAYFRASPAYGLFLRGSIVVLFLSSYGRGEHEYVEMFFCLCIFEVISVVPRSVWKGNISAHHFNRTT
jgi:hypothetical protein